MIIQFFSNSMIFPCMELFFRDFPGFPGFPELVGTLNVKMISYPDMIDMHNFHFSYPEKQTILDERNTFIGANFKLFCMTLVLHLIKVNVG